MPSWFSNQDFRAIAALSVISAGIYLNTLPAGFTFDDNFAVISNGDVSDPNTPILRAFVNDFWGQQITSDQSHKSYRPLTVLSFRLQRFLGQFLPRGFSRITAADHDNTRGLNPLPFHLANIFLHSLATCLVYWLAAHLIQLRSTPQAVKSAVEHGEEQTSMAFKSEAAQSGLRQRRRSSTGHGPKEIPKVQQSNAEVGGQGAVGQRQEALLAGLLFGLHPIHTEAVAGIVGQAELLCASLWILALLAYMGAVDGRIAGRALDWGHWPLLAAAVTLTLLAALAKEIGITIVAAMICYDAMLATPVLLAADHKAAKSAVARPGTARQRPQLKGSRLWTIVQDRMVLRISTMVITVVGYVVTRKHLAGDHLVRIYRKVENPIAFAETRTIRDQDTNAEGQRSSLQGDAAAQNCLLRWQLLVAYGLMVAPFIPASNVLFYVGTFIGERLLYMPSIGFCILAAGALTQAAGPALPWLQAHALRAVAGSRHVTGSGAPALTTKRRAKVAAVLIGLLLCAYAGRTVVRNADWVDEEQLFVSAQKVCWNSAKVQLNSGILQRRYQKWDEAISHFERARTIDPGYCEPAYWIGLCLVNQGKQASRGIEELEKAIDCKYVAHDAVTALVTVYSTLQQTAPKGDPRVRYSWAQVLLHPRMDRVEEACDLLEQAAFGTLTAPEGAKQHATPSELMRPCHKHLEGAHNNTWLAHAQTCVAARSKMLEALRNVDPVSSSAKRAIYSYSIKAEAENCRMVLTPPRHSSQAHAMLVNMVQSVDAEDAWLQAEWGQTLMADGRMQEAVKHLHVSGILLGRLARLKLQTDEFGAPDGTLKPVLGINRVTNKVGQLDREQLAWAAVWSFELALSALPDPPCVLLETYCSAVQQHGELLRSKNVDAGQLKASREALQKCYHKLQSSSGCKAAGL
ncbi:hypothetical protein WJX73_010519 [Symbiochloris irregularis]|uniref:Dolichyl-phosphate-mannose--protein mannosyltransferase n=1 Tax=Symbiochloris irregularis TaxID=706552 RepID=A0AAW1P419_9CHLO